MKLCYELSPRARCAFGNVYSCGRQLLLSVVLGSYLGSHLGNWLNFQCGIFVGRLFQSLEEELSGFEIFFSFPQSWATSLPNTLANSDTVWTHHSSTCFRFVTCLDFAVMETILSSISDGRFNTRWGGRRCHSNSLQTDLLPDRLHNSAGIRKKFCRYLPNN